MQQAQNPLNASTRPTSWLVSYEMDESFYKLQPDEQLRLETADGDHAVALALRFEWKAGYATTDFRHCWILLSVDTQEHAQQAMQSYPLHRFFRNVTYTRVYSATQGGLDLKSLWRGFREYLTARRAPP